ncbi:protein nessun dorma [Agrilus planipennis]|uniref:Protein nessun dorma n=1 Tax=Agrilus planipennis TaxID=224129 RepID=A0A1W4WNU1_AGRPL|nr:protein nessun dorma [Agrilus planipennis]
MEETIKFDKTFDERLAEYEKFFPKDIQSVSRIQKHWSSCLDLIVNEINGWHAIWKVPRNICKQHKMQYPSIVLVYVESVDCQQFIAKIEVIAIKSKNADLPDSYVVKLIDLWPTKEQEDVNNIHAIYSFADTLDMFRFFYNRILMPWDYDDDDPKWLSNHLESRLSLYYDIRNGLVSRQSAEELNSLITEARDLQSKLEETHTKLEKDDCSVSDYGDGETVPNVVYLQVRLLEIKHKVEFLENPLIREFLEQEESERYNKKSNKTEPENWLIFPEGTPTEHINFLMSVEEKFGSKTVKFCTSLIEALHHGDFNDIFILNDSQHEIKSSGAIEGGGVLRGLNGPDSTTIFSKNDDTMLECNSESTLIENLTLDVSCSKYGIVVRKGKVTLRNCKLVGNFGYSTQQGITVMPTGKLELFNTEISGFTTAVVGSLNSTVVFNGCKIFSANVGLQMFDQCKLVAKNTHFSDCYDCGIRFETKHYPQNTGNFSILKVLRDIEIENLVGENISHREAIIQEKSKIKLFHYPLPYSDDSSYSTSDEEMKSTDPDDDVNMNETVIENIKESN